MIVLFLAFSGADIFSHPTVVSPQTILDGLCRYTSYIVC